MINLIVKPWLGFLFGLFIFKAYQTRIHVFQNIFTAHFMSKFFKWTLMNLIQMSYPTKKSYKRTQDYEP